MGGIFVAFDGTSDHAQDVRIIFRDVYNVVATGGLFTWFDEGDGIDTLKEGNFVFSSQGVDAIFGHHFDS